MAVRWVRLVAVSAALVLFSSGCWAQYRGDAGHSGNQPLEFLIARGNVSTLDKAWSGPTGGAAETAPTVVAGVVYVGAADAKLYAFDAGGAGCSGSPASCPPLWTAALPSGQAPRTSPAVANGVCTYRIATRCSVSTRPAPRIVPESRRRAGGYGRAARSAMWCLRRRW